MTVRGAARRVRAALRDAPRVSERDPWNAYLASVEPALAARPRIHAFARVPELAEPDAPAAAMAVWIEGEGEPAARTRAALQAGDAAPITVLDEPLAAALAEIRCDHVMLLRAGDEPALLALRRLGQAATLAPDAAVITCDDDELSATHARRSPHFRPGPSPDRWLACDDSGPLLVVSRTRAAALVPELTGGETWRHQLALMLAGPRGEHHVHMPLLLCHRDAGLREPAPLSAGDLARVLAHWEPAARVEQHGPVRRIRRPPAHEPSVEVIVCFRDHAGLLARCVVSVLARTDYERLTLTLVDNGSASSEMAVLLDGLRRHPRVRVLRNARPFNFAALNNAAVASSEADVLVFLNNDVEVIDSDWVSDLLEEAVRPEVGAVAPLLLYPDGAVQHAGAALGLHGYAGHPFAGLAPDRETPFGRAAGGTRNWLAVTAACMMVQRAKFTATGGFDESFVVAGNDVDLCLRLTSAGHRSLCVPHVSLLHDESRSRGAHIDPGDFAASERSYGEFRTLGDPFYNPSLTLTATTCSVRTPAEGLA